METKASSLYNENHNATHLSPSSADRLEDGKVEGVFLSERQLLKKLERNLTPHDLFTLHLAKMMYRILENFAEWKKWYITCLVSFTNVLTCLLCGRMFQWRRRYQSRVFTPGVVAVL